MSYSTTSLRKAEERYERASEALRTAALCLEDQRGAYLRACGWEPVSGGLWDRGRCWRSPGPHGRLHTTWAAMREQRSRERAKAGTDPRRPRAASAQAGGAA